MQAFDNEGFSSDYTSVKSIDFHIMFKPESNSTPMGDIISTIPDKFQIFHNYPNPFNPSTQISFGLPEDSPVNISIYNVTGEKIATLVDQHLTKGYHRVTWNGTNQSGRPVSAGIYIYRMKAGQKTFVKKMFMAK